MPQGCRKLALQCLLLAAEEAMAADTTAAVAILAAETCVDVNNFDSGAETSADASEFMGKTQEAATACNSRAAQHRADAQRLFEHIDRKLDASAARVLQV